tara:strand:- start:319 stop:1011 length:693 start_codon:yes stop_codon:yes gene_type:complete
MITNFKNIIQKTLLKFGYRISKVDQSEKKFSIYKYKNYTEYKDTQVYYNKLKISHVWADELNLKLISEYIFNHSNQKKLIGICHGSRNGYEQKKFKELIKDSIVFGTDISETAKNYEDSIIWDFHDAKKEWENNFDFIYSNSLDQSYDPKKALETWINQLNTNGMLFIELSDQHNVQSSGKMDPFGVDPEYFPYLLIDWFKHKISISVLKSIKENKSKAPVWIYVVKKND